MHAFLVAIQLLVLLPMLLLAVLSHRTTRRRRGRQVSYLGLAFLLVLASMMAALVSLALVLGSDEPADPFLSFVPPLLTLAAGAVVARRSLAGRTRSRRRG